MDIILIYFIILYFLVAVKFCKAIFRKIFILRIQITSREPIHYKFVEVRKWEEIRIRNAEDGERGGGSKGTTKLGRRDVKDGREGLVERASQNNNVEVGRKRREGIVEVG